jgi:hypothetical protein
VSDTTLRDLVLKRLEAETQPEDAWSALVLAALDGPDDLARLLDEGQGPSSAPGPPASAAAPAVQGPSIAPSAQSAPKPTPSIAFLRAVTVEGFRGIGQKATLDLTPGPGLTLVVGRNGSGKSSFAEGLELLLTGDTYRWKQRTKVWREGWRNLHHPKAALAADFALEGERGACTVACEWKEDAELDGPDRWAQVKGKPRMTPDALEGDPGEARSGERRAGGADQGRPGAEGLGAGRRRGRLGRVAEEPGERQRDRAAPAVGRPGTSHRDLRHAARSATQHSGFQGPRAAGAEELRHAVIEGDVAGGITS